MWRTIFSNHQRLGGYVWRKNMSCFVADYSQNYVTEYRNKGGSGDEGDRPLKRYNKFSWPSVFFEYTYYKHLREEDEQFTVSQRFKHYFLKKHQCHHMTYFICLALPFHDDTSVSFDWNFYVVKNIIIQKTWTRFKEGQSCSTKQSSFLKL